MSNRSRTGGSILLKCSIKVDNASSPNTERFADDADNLLTADNELNGLATFVTKKSRWRHINNKSISNESMKEGEIQQNAK